MSSSSHNSDGHNSQPRSGQSSSHQPFSHGCSSSDDMRSFCDSISHLAGRVGKSLNFFGWQPTPTVNTQPHHRPISARFSSLVGLERTYVEPAPLPQLAYGMTVFYDTERDVQEMTFFGSNLCLEKQTKRGAKNPWRQYGALRKLHEIGGMAPEMLDKKHRKAVSNYVRIKKGSIPPQPPTTPEIILNGAKDVYMLKRFHIPSGVPAEQLAQSIAIEMQRMARENGDEQQQPSSDGSTSGYIQ